VLSTLRFSLYLLNGIKPASFQLQFHFWKQEEVTGCQIRGVWWVGDDNHFIFQFSSVQMTRCCFWSAVRILGTNLAVTWCMPNSSIRTRWHAHNQFPPPQQRCEWSDVNPDGRALEFVQQFQELCSCGSPCVRHRQLMCDQS